MRAWSKSGSLKTIICGFLLIAFFANALNAEQIEIAVRYPQKDQKLPAVDSTFILGQVTPGATLEINGVNVPVHSSGGFLAYLDVSPGDFVFRLKAKKGKDSTKAEWPVWIADRYRAVSRDSLAILKGYRSPSESAELASGDLLEVSFRGTPGGVATFSIPGATVPREMVESGFSPDVGWGSEVFGPGAMSDTATVAGIYRGSVYIPDTVVAADLPVVFTLRVPKSNIKDGNIPSGAAQIAVGDSIFCEITDTAAGRITISRQEYPHVVELVDSVQTIRTGPGKGYLTVFQPRGIRFISDGRYGGWRRLKLAPGVPAWVPDTSVIDLPAGTPAPHSYVKTIRCSGVRDIARCELYLDEKLPFQVEEHIDEHMFVLRVFRVSSDTDWIRYLNTEGLIDRAEWSQESENVYKLTVYLDPFLIWGWDCYYKGNTLVFDVRRGPKGGPSFKNTRFVIDPGHSKDPGAIGPTGLKEAEANLMIALRLSEILRKKGATVAMTRTDDSDVKLTDRPRIAIEKGCDIFVSVHNNSCPDGINPYYNKGVSTYYYNEHSMKLARAVQNRMISSLSLDDHGLYYGNLAVTRPTQYLSVLVECTFIILPDQEAALRTEKFQEQCAKAIADGIDDYLHSLGSGR